MKPHLLVTNDDGFDSFFLRVLVDRLLERFRVTVAAPADEQSWVGRRVTRTHPVETIADDSLGCPGWRVSGTPTDTVNIALDHLLEDPPDAVVAGINIGFNTTLPLVLSSGTVAAALEGSFRKVPALALSKVVPRHQFEEVRSQNGFVEGDFFLSLEQAAARALTFADALTVGEWESRPGLVHNINFPYGLTAETEIRSTYPAPMEMGPLFSPDGEGRYAFRLGPSRMPVDLEGSDVRALEEGAISHSRIDFASIGRPPR